jgi:hypothetical protein
LFAHIAETLKELFGKLFQCVIVLVQKTRRLQIENRWLLIADLRTKPERSECRSYTTKDARGLSNEHLGYRAF